MTDAEMRLKAIRIQAKAWEKHGDPTYKLVGQVLLSWMDLPIYTIRRTLERAEQEESP